MQRTRLALATGAVALAVAVPVGVARSADDPGAAPSASATPTAPTPSGTPEPVPRSPRAHKTERDPHLVVKPACAAPLAIPGARRGAVRRGMLVAPSPRPARPAPRRVLVPKRRLRLPHKVRRDRTQRLAVPVPARPVLPAPAVVAFPCTDRTGLAGEVTKVDAAAGTVVVLVKAGAPVLKALFGEDREPPATALTIKVDDETRIVAAARRALGGAAIRPGDTIGIGLPDGGDKTVEEIVEKAAADRITVLPQPTSEQGALEKLAFESLGFLP